MAVGAVQQLPSAAGPILCKDGVPADHQALSRVGGIGDFRQIHLLEQRRLEGALLDQFTDGWPAQGRDPVQAVGGEIRLEAGRAENPPVRHENHLLEAEPLLDLGNLVAQGEAFRGVPLEHLHGDWNSFPVAEQAHHDLELVVSPLLAVAVGSQFAGLPFQVNRGQVVEQQGPILEMAFGQLAFDGLLMGQKPVHGLV
jgi:hypothetical protein